MSAIVTATATFQPSRAGLSPRTMYFPPPPPYDTQSSNTKKSIPFTFNFKSQSQSQSRPTSTSTSTSSPPSITLQNPPPPRPILKRSLISTKHTRQWILLSLLLLSFTILILSVIFAYCAALPHSDNIADAQAAEAAAVQGFDGPVTSTISVVAVSTAAGARAGAPTTIATSSLSSSPDPTAAPSPFTSFPSRLLTLKRDTPTNPTQEMTPSEIDAALSRDQANQSRFSTPSAQLALTFYTAALPLLTILHAAVELLVSLVRAETSQGTKVGDLVLGRGRAASASANSVITRRRIGTLLSFTVSVLLLLGWITMQLFTLNCEIVTFGAGGEGVCPVQIRGHRMGGVSELSVGKVGLGFLVVGGYLGYLGVLVWRVGVLGGGKGRKGRMAGGRGVAGFKRRARFVEGDKGEIGNEKGGDGDVESVSVGSGNGMVRV